MNGFEDHATRKLRERRETARDRMTNLSQTMLEVTRALQSELRDAATTPMPLGSSGQALYTDEGLQAHRADLVAQVRETATPHLRQLRDGVESDARVLREHADGMRPRLGDDAATQMRAQRKWDGVRMMLDARMPLRQVVESTDDVETLLAIADWAPSYLDAVNYKPPALGERYVPQDHSHLQRSITARIAALSPHEVAEALTAASEADVALAGFGERQLHLEGLAAGDDVATATTSLQVAIAASLAESDARSLLELPTKSEPVGPPMGDVA